MTASNPQHRSNLDKLSQTSKHRAEHGFDVDAAILPNKRHANQTTESGTTKQKSHPKVRPFESTSKNTIKHEESPTSSSTRRNQEAEESSVRGGKTTSSNGLLPQHRLSPNLNTCSLTENDVNIGTGSAKAALPILTRKDTTPFDVKPLVHDEPEPPLAPESNTQVVTCSNASTICSAPPCPTPPPQTKLVSPSLVLSERSTKPGSASSAATMMQSANVGDGITYYASGALSLDDKRTDRESADTIDPRVTQHTHRQRQRARQTDPASRLMSRKKEKTSYIGERNRQRAQ